MDLIIESDGSVRCLYDEMIDLATLGQLHITRASHVEPTSEGHWLADLSPVGGPLLGPFAKRADALESEATWLRANWLPGQS